MSQTTEYNTDWWDFDTDRSELEELRDRLGNYTYTHKGKEYKIKNINTAMHEYSNLQIYSTYQAAWLPTSHIRFPFIDNLDEIFYKANKNINRFFEHHVMHLVHDSSLGLSADRDGVRYIYGALKFVILADISEDKPIDYWYDLIVKAFNKFFFVYFTVIDEVKKAFKTLDPQLESTQSSLSKLEELHQRLKNYSYPYGDGKEFKIATKVNEDLLGNNISMVGDYNVATKKYLPTTTSAFRQVQMSLEKGITNFKRFYQYSLDQGLQTHSRHLAPYIAKGIHRVMDSRTVLLTQIRTYIDDKKIETKSIDEWESLIKKLFNKFFFIYLTLIEGANKVLEDQGKIPFDVNDIKPYGLSRVITENAVVEPEVVEMLKKAKEKVDNYEYVHQGKSYRAKTFLEIHPDYLQVQCEIQNEVYRAQHKILVNNNFEKLTRKANINFFRFIKYYDLEAVHMAIFGLSPMYNESMLSDPIFGQFITNIDKEHFEGKTVDEWWKDFRKVLNKFYLIFFILIDQANDILKEYNIPLKTNPETN